MRAPPARARPLLPLALLCAGLAGCATAEDYLSSINPFRRADAQREQARFEPAPTATPAPEAAPPPATVASAPLPPLPPLPPPTAIQPAPIQPAPVPAP